ncbi:hypothetical protein ACQPZA_13795 [Pseudonocardia xinjiangensis]|uniref:hypothetical protein n=1 Tax=Pseudonocardia xinjiangensis TaxID=75289 RepID=UPI003D91F603
MIDLAYAYLFIGDLDAIVNAEAPNAADFVSAHEGFIKIRTGTHTGKVEVEMRIVDEFGPILDETAEVGEVVVKLAPRPD